MGTAEAGFYLEGQGVARRGGAFSPADAVALGQALGRLGSGGAVGVASSGAPAFRALAAAAGAGIAQTGAVAWDFGDCFESQFSYCVGRSAADFGLYVGGAGVRVCSRGGLPLSPEEGARLLELLESPAAPVPYAGYGGILPMDGVRELYPIELIKSAVCTLTGMSVSVKCASRTVGLLAEEALSRLGCRFSEGGLTLQLSGDGRDVSVYDKVSDYIFTDRILALVCMDLFRRGQDAAVPASSPRVLDRLAERWGRRALRYEDGFSSDSDRTARSLGLRQPFLRDGLMLGIRLLSGRTGAAWRSWRTGCRGTPWCPGRWRLPGSCCRGSWGSASRWRAGKSASHRPGAAGPCSWPPRGSAWRPPGNSAASPRRSS